ncbi:MAG: hypothetical protein QOF23_587, partial [Solirubrobacterales bacterium]|nr:hypothetical protein [Solirubrobacterales bacterium]
FHAIFMAMITKAQQHDEERAATG